MPTHYLKFIIVLFLTTSVQTVFSQDTYTITGTVYQGTTKEGLRNIDVILECDSTNIKTLTDSEGKYKLTSIDKPQNITFSHRGFTKSRPVNIEKTKDMVLDVKLSIHNLNWENGVFPWNADLEGYWSVVYFKAKNKKKLRVRIPLKGYNARNHSGRKIRHLLPLRFHIDLGKPLSTKAIDAVGSLSYYDGCNSVGNIYCRSVAKDKIEFKTFTNVSTAKLCIYNKEDKALFYTAFKNLMTALPDSIATYKLKGKKLYLSFEGNKLMLRRNDKMFE